MLTPGTPITLSTKDQKALGKALGYMLDDLERTYNPYFENLRVWWTWYDAIPKSRTKNFPFKSASNIVVPLIQVMSDSLVARTYGGIFGAGNNVWTTRTENETFKGRTNNIKRWINWAAAGNDFNLRLPLYDWLNELVPIGSSVVDLNWVNDVRFVFAGQGRGKARKWLAQPVSFGRGPKFEHVPREQVLWDTQYRIYEAPLVAREFNLTWSQINHISSRTGKAGGWIKENVEYVKDRWGIDGSPGQTVRRQKADSDGFEFDRSYLQEGDIRRIDVDWPVLQSIGGFEPDNHITRPGDEDLGQPSIPVRVTLHRSTSTILSISAYPYMTPYKTMFDGFYQKRPGRGHSIGMAKRLEHMQLGMTTATNQMFDARTRANAIWGKTNSRELLKREIDPRTPLYVSDMASFEPLNLPTTTFDDASLLTILQTFSERATGQADPLMGRETRSGGHPSPATSTLALMKQGDLLGGPHRDLIRMEVGRMGEATTILYQQFDENIDNRYRTIFGDKDAADIEGFLFPQDGTPITGNLTFDVLAMSEHTNPDAEMNRAIAVTQMNTNYWAFVLRALQAMQQSQGNPIIQQAAIKSIEAQTNAHVRFLEAGDIDDIEAYILQLRQGAEQGQDLRGITSQLGQLAANQGAAGQPAPSGLGGSFAESQSGAPGGIALQ